MELTRIPATLIPGDGIGPEIMEATGAVLDALGAPFDWQPATVEFVFWFLLLLTVFSGLLAVND